MKVESIGILGKGDFGAFLEERIHEAAPRTRVLTWDKYKPNENSFEEVVGCQVIILAVPPLAFEESLLAALPHLKRRQTIVDICTVKMHTVSLLNKYAAGVRYFAAHPLFGRQSFIDNGNSMRGLDLVVCASTLTKWEKIFIIDFLKRLKLNVVEMSAQEHDSGPGVEQLVAQFDGIIMRKAGFVRNAFKVHTRSANHLYTAMELTANDEALFEQVAQLNPYWPETKSRYASAVRHVLMHNGRTE